MLVTNLSLAQALEQQQYPQIEIQICIATHPTELQFFIY
jgi:hypothetical protein